MALLLLLVAISAQAQSTADHNANHTTRNELAWLYSLTGKSSKRLIQSDFSVVRNCAGSSEDCTAQESANYTGNGNQYMGGIGVDYCNGFWGDPSTPMCQFGTTSSASTLAKQFWAAGSVVTMGMHFPNPFDNYNNIPANSNLITTVPCPGAHGSKNMYTGQSQDCYGTSDASVLNMITPGTTANAKWNSLLDNFVVGLQDLQANGVTVLMKTMHEQNDNGIWWESGLLSDATRQQLFRYIENYFNNIKGLHNLLWAYVIDGSNSFDATGGYPGSQYVDVVGFDTYANWTSTGSVAQSSYSPLTALGKPMAIFEYNCDLSGQCSPTYDFEQFMQDIKKTMPQVMWVNYWWGYNPGSRHNPYWQTYVNDPWSIMRSGIPNLSGATPSRLQQRHLPQ
jgi:hypothetical protein